MTGYTFNQLFDFTRTTAATFVGSNGLIQLTPASVNVLTFTQEFDNAVWSKIGLGTGSPPVVTANAAIAPDGTPTADLVAFNRGAGNAIGDRSTINSLPTVVNGLTYVASIYIKAATGADIGKQVAFRGVAGVGYQVITLTADWVRISSAELSSGTTGNFELASRGTISADNQVSALLWGAQLELGSTPTTYARNNGGLFPPRFDYDPVTLAPRGILIEEQRTNLVTYSDQFDNAAWSKARGSVTASTTISPDGTTNADTLTATATGTYAAVFRTGVSYPGGAAYTFSIYAKANVGQYLILYINETGDVGRAVFDLNSGAISLISAGTTASITSVGNGWWRCVVTATPTLTASGVVIAGVVDTGSGTTVTSGKSLFLYGAQLEAGAFVTSYIPTVASQVTRTADICTISAPMFAPWYNQSAGTFIVDVGRFSSVNSTGTAGFLSATDNPLTNDWILMFGDGLNTTAQYFNSGTTQASLPVSPIASGGKMSFAYALNDFATNVNGGAVSTDTSGTLSTDITILRVGAFASNPSFLNGHIRRVQFYPFRASNNQLQALST